MHARLLNDDSSLRIVMLTMMSSIRNFTKGGVEKNLDRRIREAF